MKNLLNFSTFLKREGNLNRLDSSSTKIIDQKEEIKGGSVNNDSTAMRRVIKNRSIHSVNTALGEGLQSLLHYKKGLNNMKRIISTLLAALLAIAALPIQSFATDISGGVVPTINLGETISGERETYKDDKLYTFEVPTSGSVEVRFIGDLSSVNLKICDASDERAWTKGAFRDDVTGQLTIIETVHLTAGTYFFKIGQGSGYGIGNYDLTLSHTAITESFPESQTNNQNSLATAKAISFNQAYTGYLAKNDDKNFYEFTLNQADTVTIFLTSDFNSRRIYIYDINGKSVFDTSTVSAKEITTVDLSAGTYYLCITNIISGYGLYSFSLSAASDTTTTETTQQTTTTETTQQSATTETTQPATTQATTSSQSSTTQGSTFTDVPATHWAYSYVEKASNNELVSGVGNNKYNPDRTVSNAEWATMVVNLFYKNDTGRSGNYWWSANMDIAGSQRNILSGTTVAANGTSSWDANKVQSGINRYDMASVIYNIAKEQGWSIPDSSNASSQIGDWSSIPSNYREAVAYCFSAGFVTGVDNSGTFSGTSTMTRAQAATVLCRLLDAKS